MKTAVMLSLAVLATAASARLSSQSIADKVIEPNPEGKVISVGLPIVDGADFSRKCLALARAAHAAIGLELIRDQGLPDGVVSVPRNMKSLPAAGRTLRELLDLLISNAPAHRGDVPSEGYRFAWRENGGVIHISPLGMRATFLDTVLPSFDESQKPTLDVVIALVRRFDQAVPERRRQTTKITAGPVSRNQEVEKREEAAAERLISVSKKNATLRSILDAIVLANGEMSWVVEYSDAKTEHNGSIVRVHTLYGTGYGYGSKGR